MIIETFAPIVERILVKLQGVLNSSWGWLMSFAAFLLNFMAPVKYAFAAMGLAILMDMAFGMLSARKQGKFLLRSEERRVGKEC